MDWCTLYRVWPFRKISWKFIREFSSNPVAHTNQHVNRGKNHNLLGVGKIFRSTFHILRTDISQTTSIAQCFREHTIFTDSDRRIGGDVLYIEWVYAAVCVWGSVYARLHCRLWLTPSVGGKPETLNCYDFEPTGNNDLRSLVAKMNRKLSRNQFKGVYF